MLVVNFLVTTLDYLIFILFAHHIKQTFRNVFHSVGFDTFALLFDVNDDWCNRGDGYFNLEEISSDHPGLMRSLLGHW